MESLDAQLRRQRFETIEDLLQKALTTLTSTHGRAAVDNRGIGACRFMMERSLESLAVIRREEQFRKLCSCGISYDEHGWSDLEIVGDQDDGDGGLLELRNCPCGSTIAIEKLKTNV